MKFDNYNIWLTENVDTGKTISELRINSVYDHQQATVYYEKGIDYFDNAFKHENYIKAGYLCTLMASENTISLFFLRYNGEKIADLGVAHIKRLNITSYEEIESDNLEVVKKEELKHKAKYMHRRGAGIIGSVSGLIAEKFVSANTHIVSGGKFILHYIDEHENLKSIILYSSEEDRFYVQLFLNTYYKNVLPPEALIENSSQTSSNCFIATACYRDIYSPEVILLRKYRDDILSKSSLGKQFIKFYYFTSPTIYRFLIRKPYYSKKIKVILDKLILRIKF